MSCKDAKVVLSPFPQDSGWHFRLGPKLPWLRPFLKPTAWFKGINPWFYRGKEHRWFTLVAPALCYPFVSYRGKRFEWYIGWKHISLGHPEYSWWLPERFVFDDFACTLSFTFRRRDA